MNGTEILLKFIYEFTKPCISRYNILVSKVRVFCFPKRENA